MSAKSMLAKCGLTAADVRRLTEPYRIRPDDGKPPRGPWMGFKGGCSMSRDTAEDADRQYQGFAE